METQKWEMFCKDCHRVMTFTRTIAAFGEKSDAAWTCSDTEKPGAIVEGCGAQQTF